MRKLTGVIAADEFALWSRQHRTQTVQCALEGTKLTPLLIGFENVWNQLNFWDDELRTNFQLRTMFIKGWTKDFPVK